MEVQREERTLRQALASLHDLGEAVARVLANKDLAEHFHAIEAKRAGTTTSAPHLGVSVVVIGDQHVGKSTLVKSLLPPSAYDASFTADAPGPVVVRIRHADEGFIEIRTSGGREVCRQRTEDQKGRQLGAMVQAALKEVPPLKHDEHVVVTYGLPLPSETSFELVDTPPYSAGVSASIGVREALQQADVVLLVSSCTASPSDSSRKQLVWLMQDCLHLLEKVILVGTHADLVKAEIVDVEDWEADDEEMVRLQEAQDKATLDGLLEATKRGWHAVLAGFLTTPGSAHLVDLPTVLSLQRSNQELPEVFASLRAELLRVIVAKHDQQTVLSAVRLIGVARRWMRALAQDGLDLPDSPPTRDNVASQVDRELRSFWKNELVPQMREVCESLDNTENVQEQVAAAVREQIDKRFTGHLLRILQRAEERLLSVHTGLDSDYEELLKHCCQSLRAPVNVRTEVGEFTPQSVPNSTEITTLVSSTALSSAAFMSLGAPMLAATLGVFGIALVGTMYYARTQSCGDIGHLRTGLAVIKRKLAAEYHRRLTCATAQIYLVLQALQTERSLCRRPCGDRAAVPECASAVADLEAVVLRWKDCLAMREAV